MPTTARSVAPAAANDERGKAMLWVGLGAFWLALMLYVWAAWIVSGDIGTNKTGRGLEPDWYHNLINVWQVFALVVSVWIFWHFVVRPRVKTGHFTFDSLFFIGCLALLFQEPWINWTSYQFQYSTNAINFGSWTNQIPGWSSPDSENVPLALWALSAYFWLVGIPAYVGAKYMMRMRAKDPGMGRVRLVAQTYLAFCIFDILLESFITRTQLFNYASVVPELSLWAGTDHQFPVYETISWAGTYTGLSCLYFFRDDQGRSLPERGIDKLRIKSAGLTTFARGLAIMGACQMVMLFTYNIPYTYWGQHAEMAQPFVERDWRNGGICGPKTAYDCPADGVPLARKEDRTNRVVEVPAQ